MKIDTMLSGLDEAGDQARRLEELGVDGGFTFEGPHDVFTPLRAGRGGHLFARTGHQRGHRLSPQPGPAGPPGLRPPVAVEGRFTLGLGAQVRAQVEKRYGASFDRPIARMRELVAALRAIFATWETGDRLDFRGEFSVHTLMPPPSTPGPTRSGCLPSPSAGWAPRWCAWPPKWPTGSWSCRSTRRALPPAHPSGHRGGAGSGGRSRSELTVTGEVIVCCGRDEAEMDAARREGGWLLAFYASTPAYRPVLEVEGWEDLQPELNMLSKSGAGRRCRT